MPEIHEYFHEETTPPIRRTDQNVRSGPDLTIGSIVWFSPGIWLSKPVGKAQIKAVGSLGIWKIMHPAYLCR
jgi:hypothetical protein